MKIEYLYEFVKLAELGSFQNTADSMYISQPTLSKHIQSIEQELGLPLINRKSSVFSLTSAGMEYLAYAKQICDIQNRYLSVLNNRGKQQTLNISMCVLSSEEDKAFSAAIERFTEEFPKCLIRTHHASAPNNFDALINDFESSLFSILIIKYESTEIPPIPKNHIEYHQLSRFPLSVLMRRNHPLAGKEITLNSLNNLHLVSRSKPLFEHELILKYFTDVHFSPVFANTLNSMRCICGYLPHNDSVYLMTEPIGKELAGDELRIQKIEPEINLDTLLICNNAKMQSFEKRFVELLTEEFSKRQAQ